MSDTGQKFKPVSVKDLKLKKKSSRNIPFGPLYKAANALKVNQAISGIKLSIASQTASRLTKAHLHVGHRWISRLEESGMQAIIRVS